MAVDVNLEGSTLTIKVVGRFDFSVHQEFRTSYEGLSPTPTQYVIDLGETSYLDSSALGMLLLLRDFSGGDSADIRIANCNQDVKKILAISNFEQLFKID